MKVTIGSQIKIEEPTAQISKWCHDNLILTNPDYVKKQRMGFWTGNTPQKLFLYETNGDTLLIPFGCLRSILGLITGATVSNTFVHPETVDYNAEVSLRSYQTEALDALIRHQYGILQAPAGSGKTQIGIALACELGVKTLWLTHTKDLLNQSRDRAEQYVDEDLIGTITEGKVNVGAGITFATIQTMCKVDLDKYRDVWDCIIVDECHRVAGSPTAVTQFSKVLNRLKARHKYGLSATVHRADGLIKSTYSLLGEIVHTVPDEAVAEFIMRVNVQPIATQVQLTRECLNPDGTINYTSMITFLTKHYGRNAQITQDLVDNRSHYNLILSERVGHLIQLYENLPPYLQEQAVMVDGTMTSKKQKEERNAAFEQMREGKKHYLFATYALAKEGLDIPRLDRLYLTTPQKDYAVITQSVGRVGRVFPGKEPPIVYDYVDANRAAIKSFKKRCTSYRKCNCTILEDK